MRYEILYEPDGPYVEKYKLIQRDVYYGEEDFTAHSEHKERETAELVKEALEARESKK